jgi:hypothetical protein
MSRVPACGERVATVSAVLTVGFSASDQPTVNSDCELTVATEREVVAGAREFSE